jgi:uncharacterized protein (TIGR02453 family)
MITAAMLEFLRGLKSNNNREWFQDHKAAYEAAYGDFFDTLAGMIEGICSFDKDIAEKRPDPKSCIMRIYRDVRFSKDKTPYKTGFFAYVSAGGRKGPLAGYYLHIEPDASFAGGGLYMPEAPILDRTRRSIDGQYDEWLAIVRGRQLLEQFPKGVQPSGATKRPPKGYDADNAAIEYLKYKGYYTQRFYSDAETMSDRFADQLSGAYRAVTPLVAFLNRSIGSIS